MAKVANLDELKRQHEWARIAKVGSKEWIDFASTMLDSFPALYDIAKRMNDESERLRDALRRIADMTDADNPESYRCDDREGCFDTVFAVATNTIKTPNAKITGG